MVINELSILGGNNGSQNRVKSKRRSNLSTGPQDQNIIGQARHARDDQTKERIVARSIYRVGTTKQTIGALSQDNQ
jgi:hypothetical protein